tara:strand:- start:1776 stop:3443 length:1668 start_codon:yes stop_codon:yes gene_type:complete
MSNSDTDSSKVGSSSRPFQNFNNEKKSETKNEGETDQLPTDQTDMMVNYLVNPNKLVSEEKIHEYNKEEYINDKKDTETEYKNTRTDTTSKTSESEADDFVNKENKSHNVRGTKYGPSYGDGTTDKRKSDDSDSEDEIDETHFKKLDMLRKLGELTEYGVRLSQNYNINSSLKAMKYEYQLHMTKKDKKVKVGLLCNGLKVMTGLLETANRSYNPFDIDLDGWGENVSENIGSYTDVFGEIYEKYNKPGKDMSPELKLVLVLGSSAAQVAIANYTMNALPDSENELEKDPQLKAQLIQKAKMERLERERKQNSSLNQFEEKENDNIMNMARDYQTLREHRKEYIKKDNSNKPVTNNVSLGPSKLPPGFANKLSQQTMKQPDMSDMKNRLQQRNSQQNVNHNQEQMEKMQQQMQHQQQIHQQQMQQLQKQQQMQNQQMQQQSFRPMAQPPITQNSPTEKLQSMINQVKNSPQSNSDQRSKLIDDLKSIGDSDSISQVNPKIEDILKEASVKKVEDDESAVSSLTKSRKSSKSNKSNISISFGKPKRRKKKVVEITK